MAAGRAEAYSKRHGVRVAIVDEAGRPREHDAWLRNPFIDQSSHATITDCPGRRGYMLGWDYDDGHPRAVFNPDYRNRDHPGRLYLPGVKTSEADDKHVVIEPNITPPGSINKDWGFNKWQRVVDDLISEGYAITQCVEDYGRPLLNGATHIKTPTFWHAALIINRAVLVLTVEGGTHHMAGALRKPAVVVFGGFTHPDTTGYDGHTNLYAGGEACGRYGLCSHCRDAMASISVDQVLRAAYDLLP